MSGINKVILIGRLGAKPEIKQMQNGGSVATLNLATSEVWKDKNTGEKKENTDWHRVVIFGKLADIAGQYLDKGSNVYVEGKLKTRKWQDQNGQDKYTTEVVLTGFDCTMQMLDNKPQQTQQQAAPQQPVQQAPQQPAQDQQEPPFDDSIPF